MNTNNQRIFYMVVSCIMISHQNTSAFSFPTLTAYTPSLPSFLSTKQEEEIMQKEYSLSDKGVLHIKNMNGDVCIKTAWNSNKVLVTATKRAGTKELLQNITINERNTPHVIALESRHLNDTKGRIDYTLIVPARTALNIATQQGNIIAQEVHGPLTVITNKGNIEVHKAHDTIIATAQQNGSIIIRDTQGKIQATATKGDITITDAVNSVFAKTEYGKINMKSKHVPSLSTIKLATQSGPIEIQLPAQVSADVKANTQRGTIMSQLPITLKPYTTTLDSQAWRQFKEQVHGTFGTGDAQIVLHAKRGHIRIRDIQTA